MPASKQRALKKRSQQKKSKKTKASNAIAARWQGRDAQNEASNQNHIPTEQAGSQPELSTSKVTSKETDEPKVNLRLADLEKCDIQEDAAEDSAPRYHLIDFSLLESLISQLHCPECLQGNLKIVVVYNHGLANKYNVDCEDCQSEGASALSSKRIPNTKKFDVNRRIVQSFLSIGKGHSALQQFSMIMNLDQMAKKSYHEHSRELLTRAKISGIDATREARKRVREFYMMIDPDGGITCTSVIDLGVTFDGTWQKRGFTSNYCVASVIHIETGLVLDYVVLSKYCHNCAMAKHDLGGNSADFAFWYEGHKHCCEKNYEGSSNAMETAAAEILWKNSITFNLRYTVVLCDGDSKVYSHLSELKPYGDDVEIVKEDCVNHVSKRLGTALRNSRETGKAKGVTLGGQGYGQLTLPVITKLQKYYKNAVLENDPKGVDAMQQGVLAALDHCSSSDDHPKHSKCPTGESSFCFYNRALAQKKKTEPQKKMLKTPLNSTVVKYIEPIYKRLSDPGLLSRCQRGKTQNLNESLHSMIWSRCPKSKNSSKKLIEGGAAQAVGLFNSGQRAIIESLRKCGISPSKLSRRIGSSLDRKRKLRIASRKDKLFQRKRRAMLLQKRIVDQQAKKKEGVTYKAGGFDC